MSWCQGVGRGAGFFDEEVVEVEADGVGVEELSGDGGDALN